MAQKYRVLLTTCPWTVCPEPVLAKFRVSKKQMKTRRLQLSRCAAARTRTRTGATATAPAWTAAARKRRSLQCDENGLFSRASFPLRLKGTRSPAKTGSGQTCTCIQRKTQRQPRQRIVFFKMICYVLLRFVLLCYVLFCFVLFWQAEGTHTVQLSPQGTYLIDTCSSATSPPVVTLRDASNGAEILPLDAVTRKRNAFF